MPTTVATDDFNRADGPLGADWTNQTTGGQAPQIVSNAVRSGDSNVDGGYAFWGADAFEDDQYSEVTIQLGLDSSGKYLGPTVRAAQTGASLDCYIGMVIQGASAKIFRMVDHAAFPGVEVADLGAVAWADGDVVRLEAVGTQLEMFRNGLSLGTGIDAVLTSGSAGLFTSADTDVIDDWEGGNMGDAAGGYLLVKN